MTTKLKKYLEKYETIINFINNFHEWQDEEYKLLSEALEILYKKNGGEKDLKYENGKLIEVDNNNKIDINIVIKVINDVDDGLKDAFIPYLYIAAIADVYREKFSSSIVSNYIYQSFNELMNKYRNEFIDVLKKMDEDVICRFYDIIARNKIRLSNEYKFKAYLFLLVENLCNQDWAKQFFEDEFIDEFMQKISIGGYSELKLLVKTLIKYKPKEFIDKILNAIYNSDVINDNYKMMIIAPILKEASENVKNNFKEIYLNNIDDYIDLCKSNVDNGIKDIIELFKDECNSTFENKYWKKILPLIEISGYGKDYDCYQTNHFFDVFDI